MSVRRKHYQLSLGKVEIGLNILAVPLFVVIFSTLGCSSCSTEQMGKSSAKVLISSERFHLVDIARVTDGGSMVYSFLNEQGEVLHLWEDNSIPSRGSDRRYYLKIKYDDLARVEVLRNSLLERQVLDMLEKCSRTRDSFPPVPHTLDSILNDLGTYLRNRQRGERTVKHPQSAGHQRSEPGT